METAIKVSDEFASTMQELSAQAEKSLPEGSQTPKELSGQLEQTLERIAKIETRLRNMETGVISRIEQLSRATEAWKTSDGGSYLAKIDDQVSALRTTESVNQKLFDRLHEELIQYRDNFLHESLQKPFVRDLLVVLYDLEKLSDQMQKSGRTDEASVQWRDNLDNVTHSLVEVLNRLGATEMEQTERVDRSLHRVVNYEPAESPEEDGRIVTRLRRGFLWRGSVLRPEEVVAKRFAGPETQAGEKS